VHEQPEPSNRRSFLKWVTHGLGAAFSIVLGFPVISYLIDPRNRPNPPSDFRPVRGVRLSQVGDNPVQGIIRAVRHDAWTLYPNDVIGRVWIRRVKPGTDKDCFEVFSTVCPHLGCAINSNTDQAANPGFTCPCHDGRFTPDGDRKPNVPGYDNPAPRGMDTLEFDVARDPDLRDENNRDLLMVKYETFEAANPEKVRRG
jgi:menaquinol-cytochrome c reductase iron-sulfur subunit